jgi:hypothetical protein
VHVHPTTAPVALLGWLFVSSSRRAGASAGSVVLAMAAGAAVLFLPYAWSQWSGGMPDVPAAASYLAGQLRVENLWNVPMVLATTLLNGVAVVAMRIAGLPQAAAIALAVVFAAPLLALLPLLAARTSAARAARSVAFRLLAWSLLLAAWIAWLRPTTPVYFVYALVPWLAGLVALGLWCLPASGAGRLAVAGFVLLAAGSGIATTFQMAKVVRHGEGVVTSQVLDVKELDPALVHADTWFPASGREALGRFLCSQPKGVALHGHLAFIVDRSVGVDALFACRDASFIALGGQAANLPHWVGLSRRFASRANVRGDCRIGSLEVMRATPHGGPESLAIPDGRRYFPREHGKAAPSRVRREFSAPAGHALLVTNMLHGYESFKGLEVAVSGKRVAPVAGNDLSHLFAPPAGSEASVAWSVSFETTRAGAVDVATFPVTSPGTCAP